jgi:hypothetical protein
LLASQLESQMYPIHLGQSKIGEHPYAVRGANFLECGTPTTD